MKPSSLLLISFFFLFSSISTQAQNGTCLEAEVLCLENGFVIFENCFNGNTECTESGEAGVDYGCLGSTPFPNWQLLEVAESGDIDLEISQNTSFDENGNATGTPTDIDFAVYGPFSNNADFCDPSFLGSPIDCSFSAAPIEVVSIPNAQSGEIYVMMTTNFNQTQAFIQIEQLFTNSMASLACELSTEFITSCEGETVVLDATPQTSGDFQYQWEVLENDVFITIPDETDAILSVTQEGLYRGIANEGGEEVSAKQFNVTFVTEPIANDPGSFVFCDADNDGFVSVDLNTFDESIVIDQVGLIVSYFATLEDANTNMNPLQSPFEITFQTIYARVSVSDGSCFDTTAIDVLVEPTPQALQAPDISLVDSDSDGVEIFDLTVNQSIIIGDQDPSAVAVSYFTSAIDAQNGDNAIQNPTTYSNLSTIQTIYVNVSSAASGCFNTTSFNIEVLVDTDGDGVPDFQEDINGNGDLTDDDTDDDGIPDYQDEDDDGDSVDTSIETMGDGAGAINEGDIDTDNDGIFNYLDNDDDGDGILTIDEDYNGNGTPLDDDTNGNNLPDFLDADVALSVSAFAKANISVFPNPVSTSLRIEGIDVNTIEKVIIYDVSGKKLLQSDELTNNGIEVSSLSNGIYFLTLTSGNDSLIKRFIKQ